MYTECPECRTAFRLTAKILKQAHGRVRCGGCGNTFNAIDHLSEDASGETPGNSTTAHLFDERSKQLLESLDQMTGPQAVRIEDTGVEWRVLDGDAENENESLTAGNDPAPDNSPTGTIQWSLEETEEADSPADEEYDVSELADDDLDENLNEDLDDIAEPWPDAEPGIAITAREDHAEADADSGATGQTANWQLEDVSNLDPEVPRDDPAMAADAVDDEFGTGAESVTTTLPPEGSATALDDDPESAIDGDPAAATTAGATEVRYDDNTPLPDENFRPYDEFLKTRPDDSKPAAISKDDSPTAEAGDSAEQPADPQADLEFGEAVDWQDLLAEVDDDGSVGDAAVGDVPDMAADDNTQADQQHAGESSLDDSSNQAIAESTDDIDATDVSTEPSGNDNSATDDGVEDAADESLPATVASDEVDGDDDTVLQNLDDDNERESDVELEVEDAAAVADEVEDAPAVAVEDEDEDKDKDEDEDEDEDEDAGIATFDIDAAEGGVDTDDDSETPAVAAEMADDLPETAQVELDDELSVEMQIDQELMRAAAENVDQPVGKRPSAGESMLVETIIMEGDTVTDLLSEAVDAEVEDNLPEGALDAEPPIISDVEPDDFAGEQGIRARNLGIAAVVLLGFVLAAQLVHANRESLVTYDSFNATIGPIYNVIGLPVTPAWDVRSWRFESTSGSTDETGQRLTIRSRIANKSEQAMPLPLVYVSLTDRFEELVGSRILRPGDYLEPPAGTSQKVAVGADFTAVINIDTPSPDATGFKLNVCYQAAAGQMRCAIEDFKN